MTIETAVRASEILKKLDELDDFRNRLASADHISGSIHLTAESAVGHKFCWSKGTDNGRYIQYIIDGIESEIGNLKYELKRL